MQQTIFILNEKWAERLTGFSNFIFFIGALSLFGMAAALFVLVCKIVATAFDAVVNVFAPLAHIYGQADSLMRLVMLIGFGIPLCALLYIFLPKLYRVSQSITPAIRAWL